MSSSLRLISSKFITRSVVPITLLSSASPNLNMINSHISSQRSFTTMPRDDIFDESWVRNMWPNISSISITLEMSDGYTYLTLRRGDEDGVWLEVPEVEKYKENTWLIQGKTDKKRFLSGFKLPDHNMKHGTFNVTLPNENEEFETNIMAKIMANIITTSRDIWAKRSWPYYDMFYDRTILGEGFCPVIARLSQINSFSIYKNEDARYLSIDISIPGDREKMKLTKKGLCVSLDMRRPGREGDGLRDPEREDVKTFFDYDTFFFEVKMKKEHYIKGIRLPKGTQKKHTMVKREMKKGVLYAIIPCCVKKEEININ